MVVIFYHILLLHIVEQPPWGSFIIEYVCNLCLIITFHCLGGVRCSNLLYCFVKKKNNVKILSFMRTCMIS